MTLSPPTILSFTAGTTIKSADVNANFNGVVSAFQTLDNVLQGVTAQQFIFLATATTSPALITQLPSVPGSDQDALRAGIPGDSFPRIGFYVRSDGFGGIRGGSGSVIGAVLYAQSGLWQTPDQFWITQTIGSGNKLFYRIDTTDRKSFGIAYNKFSDAPYWFNYTDSIFMTEIGHDGSMYVGTGTATPGNYYPQLASNGGGAAGKKIWVGTTDPAGNASEGDVWIGG